MYGYPSGIGASENRKIKFTVKIQRRNFNMNKAELVAAMAEKTELSQKDAEAALKSFHRRCS